MRRLFFLSLFLFAPAQIWAEGSYYGLGNAATSGDPGNTVDRSRVRKNAKAAPRFLSASGAPTYNAPQSNGLTSASGAPVGTPGNPIGSNAAGPSAATPSSGGGVVPGPGGGIGGGGGFGLGNGSSGFGKFSGGSSTTSSTQAPKCAQGQQLVGTQCVGMKNTPSAGGSAGGASGGGSGIGSGFGGSGAGNAVPSGGGIPTVPH